MARILVVDDSPELGELVAAMLRRDGHEVRRALSGQEALEVLGIEPAGPCGTDLVLLDLGLPDLDGAEVYQRMQAEPRTNGLPVVFVTGSADSPEGPLARRLKKPFSAETLLNLIRELLKT